MNPRGTKLAVWMGMPINDNRNHGLAQLSFLSRLRGSLGAAAVDDDAARLEGARQRRNVPWCSATPVVIDLTLEGAALHPAS